MSERNDGDGTDHYDVKAEPNSVPTNVTFTLTAEERAVLLECRRYAMIRGVGSGIAVCSVIYWLNAQGRAPTFFRRFSGVTYGIVFFGAFLWGAGSYQKKCVAKILSLENSVLADRFRKIVKKSEERKNSLRNRYETKKVSESPSSSSSATYSSHMPKQPPHFGPPPPSTELDEEPSRHKSYNDGPMLDATPDQEKEQPNAFSVDSKTSIFHEPAQENSKRGKTFEEIRQESRRKQNQSSYPTSQSSSNTPSPALVPRKKRNKYGDDFEE